MQKEQPVLEIHGMPEPGRPPQSLILHSGKAAHWHLIDDDFSPRFLDELLGLEAENQLLSKVLWFGKPIPPGGGRAHYLLLRRLLPVVAGAPLLSNINLAENILLPALARSPAEEAALGRAMIDLVSSHGGPLGLPFEDLTKLPHLVGQQQRLVASVFQAHLAKPDVIVLSNAVLPWDESWELIGPACLWLRDQLPATAWLFANSESRLPAGFSCDSIRGQE